MVRSYVVFSGTGPILVVTKSNAGLQSEFMRQRLERKGILKYMAFEVPSPRVDERYGTRFHSAAEQLAGDDDMRVVDIDGHHVFANFSFKEMGEPVFVEDDE